MLRDGEQFTIYTLLPHLGPKGQPDPEKPAFHGYTITGEARIREAAAQTAILDTLLDAVSASDGRVAACFNPRHGIRVFHQGRFLDLVICYECLHLRVYAANDAPSQVVLTQDVTQDMTRLYERAGLSVEKK
jgi:hypothetical protein